MGEMFETCYLESQPVAGACARAAVQAGVFAVSAGCYLAGRTGIALAFIPAMIVFMPLFVFLPKPIQRGMQADAQAVVDAFGKNEHVMRVIWALVLIIIGLVATQALCPGKAQQESHFYGNCTVYNEIRKRIK